MVLGGMHEGRNDEFIGIFLITCLVSTVEVQYFDFG